MENKDDINPKSFYMASKTRTVQEIFDDYCGRRKAIIRALTDDADELHKLCDPDKDDLVLYGHPSGIWEANIPSLMATWDIPKPTTGINIVRDGIKREEWLDLIAVHSEAWLICVAYYLGARLNRNQRKQLFRLINDLPPVSEIVKGIKVEDPDEDAGTEGPFPFWEDPYPFWGDPDEDEGSFEEDDPEEGEEFPDENEGAEEDDPVEDEDAEDDPDEEDEDDSEEDENIEEGDILCGYCSEKYDPRELWIVCDKCNKWFHGKCILLEKVVNLKAYQCVTCTSRSDM